MKEWLNKWIKPATIATESVSVKPFGYQTRDSAKCFCGAGLVTFYSRDYKQCVRLDKCGRKYHLHDNVEIKHQR